MAIHVLCSYAFLRPSIDEIIKRYLQLFGARTPEYEEHADSGQEDEIEPEIQAEETTTAPPATPTPIPTTD